MRRSVHDASALGVFNLTANLLLTLLLHREVTFGNCGAAGGVEFRQFLRVPLLHFHHPAHVLLDDLADDSELQKVLVACGMGEGGGVGSS